MPIDSRFLLLASLCTTAVVAHAGDVASAKAGMRERMAVVDKLKASGAVGEGNTGYLVARGGGADAETIVSAENADRMVIFKELAAKSGGSAEAAGRTFARQIAAASKPGVWLQREDGGWYKK
ncbi:MAG: hypothetical protein RLZZ50_661 [Verrucomicrobiota bacterium]